MPFSVWLSFSLSILENAMDPSKQNKTTELDKIGELN